MRTFAILVLLALMPVRLLASDAMGIRMAIGGKAEAAQSAASAAAHAKADMPDDCPMKRMAAEAHGQGGETKAACENCHFVHSPGGASIVPAVRSASGHRAVGASLHKLCKRLHGA